MRKMMFIFIIFALTVPVAVAASSCGDKSGITPDAYAKIEKGMNLDQVEAILGTPPRSHRTGPSQNPTIIWYYEKSSGEGLLKITFESAKVTNISPYDTSINPDE
ncbi:MAG: outer membrane protein assembly factor BamE [Thermoleophilia bacterium]